jgi:hypothetical protein
MWSLCWYDKLTTVLKFCPTGALLFNCSLHCYSTPLCAWKIQSACSQTILMACHIQLFFLHIRKKIVFTLVNEEVRSNNIWGIQCICVITDVLFTVVEDKNGNTIDDCDFYVLLSSPYNP